MYGGEYVPRGGRGRPPLRPRDRQHVHTHPDHGQVGTEGAEDEAG